jgi:acetoacetyl-CoA synthetase
MAADYVEKLRAVQARGPYALVGYSFGGLVALEIGEQLWEQGERCDMLCLLDTYAHQDLPWTARVRHRWERAVRKARALTAPQLLGYAATRLATAAGDAMPQFAVRPQPQAPPQFLHDSMSAALRAYRPRPYHGGVLTYVRAADRLGNYYDPLPLWRRVACAGIAVVPVPGGHLDMLGPHVLGVAAAIDGALGCVD